MKLFYRVIGRLSVALIIILAIWAGLFYFALMDEVNDEVDDALEDYSEVIITRHLAGDIWPEKNYLHIITVLTISISYRRLTRLMRLHVLTFSMPIR